jgi:hypothetical protein
MWLAQIANDHTPAAAGGVDHLTVSGIDSHMADTATSLAEKEEISGEQFGKIKGAGHYRTFLGLLGAGARQVNIGFLINKLHKS